MWDVVLATLADEFADLGDPEQFTRVALRLLLAIGLAAAIGFERELRGRTAGLRTHMMVALGVALAVVAAEQAQIELSRVLQGVLAGIGFLGAGAILKRREKEEVKGLTTAASIWATAAMAMAAGLGKEATAVLATIIALVILEVLRRADRRIARMGDRSDADDD